MCESAVFVMLSDEDGYDFLGLCDVLYSAGVNGKLLVNLIFKKRHRLRLLYAEEWTFDGELALAGGGVVRSDYDSAIYGFLDCGDDDCVFRGFKLYDGRALRQLL